MKLGRNLVIAFRNGEKMELPDCEWKTTCVKDNLLIVEDGKGLLLNAPMEAVLYVYRPLVEK